MQRWITPAVVWRRARGRMRRTASRRAGRARPARTTRRGAAGAWATRRAARASPARTPSRGAAVAKAARRAAAGTARGAGRRGAGRRGAGSRATRQPEAGAAPHQCRPLRRRRRAGASEVEATLQQHEILPQPAGRQAAAGKQQPASSSRQAAAKQAAAKQAAAGKQQPASSQHTGRFSFRRNRRLSCSVK